MATNRFGSWLSQHPFVLFFLLYGTIGVLARLGYLFLPAALTAAADALTYGNGLGIANPESFGRVAPTDLPAAPLWALATVAMIAAGSLSLPMAWLYTITRKKRGYRQSVVQTLILLPVVVAGVVVLVKFSLALAFSLAGIVAAVRFRNTLEDSKDAVFIFVATGIGLGAGVELSVALTLSLVFNFITLLLFVTDFGSTPSRLEGEQAQQRVERALDVANRTGEFVAHVDSHILEDMAPAQLEAIAERAWARRREADSPSPQDATLRVHTHDTARARLAVEPILARDTKRWELRGTEDNGNDKVLEYVVRLRKRTSPMAFRDALRADPTSVSDVELT